jgi:hypothetical protein
MEEMVAVMELGAVVLVRLVQMDRGATGEQAHLHLSQDPL